MATETDLSKSPYHDDFNPDKKFHKVLYRPGVPVQARELTQSQTLLQDQIELFGKHIFKDGSIVEGCQIGFDDRYDYVKISDTYANNFAITVSDFNKRYVSNPNGLEAVIVDTADGFISSAPNLNTLYVKYLKSANNGQKVFAPNELLTIKTESNVVIGQIYTANASIANVGNVTGFGYAVSVQDGTIFHKGFFARVEPQSLVLTKYHNQPNDLSVGFNTLESIVTPESDTSLLDNAYGDGVENTNAPGAHRLKLTPTLVSRETKDDTETDNFFSIADFIEGKPTIVRTDAQYATLGKELARRTMEESGSYIIEPFNIRLLQRFDANNVANTSYMRLEVDPGLAYVEGFRVQTIGKLINTVRKGNDVAHSPDQVISINLGNFIYCNEVAGVVNISADRSVSLRSAKTYAVSNNVSKGIQSSTISPGGSEIGTATLLAVRHENGRGGEANTVYRLYLSNIKMNNGSNFKNVKSIYSIDSSDKFFSDTILKNDECVLEDSQSKSLVYSFNQKAIKTLKDNTGAIDAEFSYLTSNTINFSNTGVATLTIPTRTGGVNRFPYSGTITNVAEKEFIIIAKSTVDCPNATGTVSTTNNSNTITGTSTTFTSSYAIGDTIAIGNSSSTEYRIVSTIANNIHMTTSSVFNTSYTNANHRTSFVQGQVIPTANTSATITVDSFNSATINLSKSFSSAFDATVIYPVLRTNAVKANKRLYSNVMVKIDTSTHSANSSGNYCLGLPDVFRLKAVYSGNTYSTSHVDIHKHFTLDNGQKDMFYDLSYIKIKNPGSVSLANTKLLVVVDAFVADTSQGIGYFSVDSYPIDDTGVTANTIYTQDISVYTSPVDGSSYNLRNCVDFRFIAANTVVYTNSEPSANINPSSILSFANTSYVSLPDSAFQSSTDYYLGRKDKVAINPQGVIVVKEGIPSENPKEPKDQLGALPLCTIDVPPYPSLSQEETRKSRRFDQAIQLNYKKNRRWTMRDIGVLAERITNLEYYTSLSLLEKSAHDMLIPTGSGTNRFKNGILVDPFAGHDIGNTLDKKYQICIDPNKTEARPLFNQRYVDLKYQSSPNIKISDNGKVATLNYTVVENYIGQPFASKVRNCVQDNIYTWAGSVTLDPAGDFAPDTAYNPDVVTNIDLYSNWNTLKNAWGTQWGTWNETSRNTLSETSETSISSTVTSTLGYAANGAYGTSTTTTSNTLYSTATTTNINQERNGIQLDVNSVVNQYDLGSYVTDISIQPWLRPKAISFTATGLKPNTRVYPYFDERNVSLFCEPEIITTDNFGSVSGVFYLPASTFKVGERTFKLVDISSYVTEADVITTIATVKYHGTNISYMKSNIDLNVTSAQVGSRNIQETRVITNTDTTTNYVTTSNTSFTPSTPPWTPETPSTPYYTSYNNDYYSYNQGGAESSWAGDIGWTGGSTYGSWGSTGWTSSTTGDDSGRSPV